MASGTKIRKGQIKTEEFIIPSSQSPAWTSEELTASQKAIADKIANSIAGVSGAMVYKGAWSGVPANGTGVKAGWVYVFEGNGTTPTGVTLESGDMLIAESDGANPSTAADWTIVQTNIDDAYLWTKLKAMLVQGNNVTLTKNDTNKTCTVTFTPVYPTISNGNAESGKYVSGMSINSSGQISVTKANLPAQGVLAESMVFGEVPSGTTDGRNRKFILANKAIDRTIRVYVNGVRQKLDLDYTIVVPDGSTPTTSILFADGAYIPDEADTLLVDYLKA